MAASVIQEAVSGASLTGGSATTITASITISAGSRLKATAIGDTGTAATATFTDDSGQGVTWTSHSGPLNISNFRMFDGSSLQFASAATFTVTCTFAAAMSTRGLLLQEVAGADNNAVQDAKGQTQNPVTAGTDVITTPSMTASGAGLVVGVTRNNGGANLTAGTGFTGGTLRWTGSGDPTLGESKHVSAGATAATWTTSSSGGAWWSSAVIFGDASAGSLTAWGFDSVTAWQEAPGKHRSASSVDGIAPMRAMIPQQNADPRPRSRRTQSDSSDPRNAVVPPAFISALVQNDYPMREWSLGYRVPPGSEGLPAAQAPVLASWSPDYAADRPRVSHRPGSEMSTVHPGTVGAWIHVDDVVRLRRATRIHDSAGVPVQLQVIPIAAWAHVEQGSRSKHRNPEYQLVSVLPALPVAGPALKPPLWAVIDGVSLSIDVDIVHLSSAVDAVSLDLDGDT